MRKKSPFPGMDPFLETCWRGVHTRLLGIISNQIAKQLPDDLFVEIEEAVSLESFSETKKAYPDVDVSSWGDTSAWEADWNSEYQNFDDEDDGVRIAKPKLLVGGEPPTRHLEIHSIESGRPLITVIELLSPANKGGGLDGRDYRAKRRLYLNSTVNFVEIDLLRKGGRPLGNLPGERDEDIPPYLVSVRRVGIGMEIYPIQLDERLPRFRIPLRPKDLPATLDLQSALDDCYAEGQYWKRLNYETDVLSPRPSTETSEWLQKVLGRSA